MTETLTLAEYLFGRLHQLGVRAIHGVPGDYNLTLLDYVKPSGLAWVGNCNELNAGYAADGYARINGVGALITTFGVGELSAINAIAGAYTERSPVVHIVGTPARASQDQRLLIHHTFNDGEYRRFAQMHALVTVAQASLWDPRTACDQIDAALLQCLLHSRPVYIEVPADLVGMPVGAAQLRNRIEVPETRASPGGGEAAEQVLDRVYTAKQPVILVDGEDRSAQLLRDIHELIQRTGWPTWTSNWGKSLVDESLPNVHGIYMGTYGDKTHKDFIDQADLVLCFSPHFSSTNSYGYSSMPRPESTIFFDRAAIRIGSTTYYDLPGSVALSTLLRTLDASNAHVYDSAPVISRPPRSCNGLTGPLTQSHLWHKLASFLRPGDIIFGETGTSGYGCRVMPLPKHTTLFTPVTWLSIGQMLPAAQGAALAQRELIRQGKYHNGAASVGRTILFIGDGSLQMTVQEMSTMIRLGLDVVIFVVNNGGYTVERCIHGLKEGYNDIAPWAYLKLPEAFGAAKDAFTARVETWEELEGVLGNEKLGGGKGLRMVEIVMGVEDAPDGVLGEMMKVQQALFRKRT